MATEDEILGSRIIGYIEPIERNEHARITVIGYKNTNDEYIFIDKKTAKSIFSPDGKVFAANFQQERNTSILKSNFVEFSAKIRKDVEPWCDKYNVDYKNLAPKTFLPILPIKYQTSLDHGFITQDELNSCIDKTTIKEIGGSFLLEYNNHLYGLFIYDKNTDEIRPKQEKTVKSYEIDPTKIDTCRVKQTDYLLRNIDKTFRQDGIIDCMDDNQLGEWFKTLIKTSSKSECLLELKKESYQDFAKQFKETNDAIDEVRLERIKGKLDALEWTANEIRELMKTNSSLTSRLTEALEKMKEEYHTAWCAEFEHEKVALNADIEALTSKKSQLEKEQADLNDIVQKKRITAETELKDIEAAYITKKRTLRIHFGDKKSAYTSIS
ncbi:MAG: hypothetical protein HDR52_05270 [Treponema sp.]|nr:hypothetical protein [Treponema sp.]